jgi:hypothetical protein
MSADLCRDIGRAHIRAVSASYVRRAKARHDPVPAEADPPQFRPGAINSTQRFGSSLELNVHLHSLFLDGVYVTRGPFHPPVFQAARPLDSAEVERVHKDIITRIRRVLERHDLNPMALGLPPRPGDEASPEQHDSPEYNQPLLDFGEAKEGSFLPGLKAASVQSAAPFGPRAGQPLRRLLDPDLARAFAAAGWSDGSQRAAPPLVTNAKGFSLHAATRVGEGNRSQLEKLCRYVTRPAICLKRLEVRADGMISWQLSRPWRDGTRAFLMTPYEFIARLASLVPHPREHQLTY